MGAVLIIGGIVILFGFVVFFGAPYVPSRRRYVLRAFENLYILSAKDTLVDLGSGDGVVLRVAADKGARAVGVEINPALVLISRLRTLGRRRVTTRWGNMWRMRFPGSTTVVYVFAVSRDEKRLVRLLTRESTRLQRELKVLCYGSPLSNRKPDKTFEAYALYTFRPLQLKKA